MILNQWMQILLGMLEWPIPAMELTRMECRLLLEHLEYRCFDLNTAKYLVRNISEIV